MKRLEQSNSFYPSPPLWKDIKYEDARYRITELAGRDVLFNEGVLEQNPARPERSLLPLD